jgi:hexulose-6-phosphate isomerase
MPDVGIMQGRLLPPADGRFQCFPRDRWAEEFGLAEQAGVDFIEWIYDDYGSDVNPIASDAGIGTMLDLSERHGVGVHSVCADYFMDHPLFAGTPAERSEGIARLAWLIDHCEPLEISRLILPFVDNSAITSDSARDRVVDAISQVSDRAERVGLQLHLETSLGPAAYVELLDRLPAKQVRVTYDIGNSASLGHDPRADFAAYGHRVGSVHVKDRVLNGGTVPLGTGDADIPAVFECLSQVGYSGDLVLQVARDRPGNEPDWIKGNVARVRGYLAMTSAAP